MTYDNITPDQTIDIIKEIVMDEYFDEVIEKYNFNEEDKKEFVEDMFYDLTEELGYTFSGMKKQEASLFHNLVQVFIKSVLHLKTLVK